MARKNTYIIPRAKKGSFLIGDSPIDGKDQVLSDDLKYNMHGLFDEQNEQRINEARKMAKKGQYTNIRIVTVWYDAVCIPQGIIGHKERSRSVKPFNINDTTKRTWTYK